MGVYGQLGFDFNNWIFLNFSGRQDWVSNTVKNNTLFYPSTSVSIIPTSAFPGIRIREWFKLFKIKSWLWYICKLSLLDTRR